ncbi:cell wall protein [Tanacetum coccineum]
MSKTVHSIILLALMFNLLISISVGGRLGRGIKPKSKKGYNPFTYNPITGGNNGIPSLIIPTFSGIGGSYIPGGDDTLVPNPGFEVPNPVGSGNIPGSDSP